MRYLLVIPLLIALARPGDTLASDVSVRIAFLINFSRFAEWPKWVLTDDAPITFCLAPGDAEMADEFRTLERQTVQNRMVKAIEVTTPDELTRCQVLYLPVELPGIPAPWLVSAERVGALTVSDRPDFIDEGGMIGLFLVNGRYRFDINLATARSADLHLSSNLLKLARSVR